MFFKTFEIFQININYYYLYIFLVVLILQRNFTRYLLTLSADTFKLFLHSDEEKVSQASEDRGQWKRFPPNREPDESRVL